MAISTGQLTITHILDGSFYEEQFASSSSHTDAPIVGWSLTVPEVQPDHYVWKRTRKVNADGTFESWTDPIRITGLAGEKGKEGEVKKLGGYIYNETLILAGFDDNVLATSSGYLYVNNKRITIPYTQVALIGDGLGLIGIDFDNEIIVVKMVPEQGHVKWADYNTLENKTPQYLFAEFNNQSVTFFSPMSPQSYIKTHFMKIISQAVDDNGTSSQSGIDALNLWADALEIQHVFESLAVLKAFIGRLTAQDLEIAEGGSIRQNYDKNGNVEDAQLPGYYLGKGRLKANDAELIGTLRTGGDIHSGIARVAIRDRVGIIEGPTFSGSGVDDLDIVAEGKEDAANWDIKITRANVVEENFALQDGWWKKTTLDVTATTYFSIYDMACSANIAVAVGTYGAWTRSTDGGKTWAPVQTSTIGYERRIEWHGVACGGGSTWIMVGRTERKDQSYSGSYYSRSTDNGLTWSTPILVDSGGNRLSGIASNGSTWIACGADGDSYGRYIRSTDDGVSWSKHTVKTQMLWTNIACSGNTWIIVTSSVYPGQAPYRSTNNGSSWSTVGASDKAYWGIAASGNTWIMLGTENNVYRSTNGGASFSSISLAALGASSVMYDLAVHGTTWIVSDRYRAFLSLNDGQSWVKIAEDYDGVYNHMAGDNGNWIIGQRDIGRLQFSTDYIAVRKNNGAWSSEIALHPKRNITIATDTIIKFGSVIGHIVEDQWSFKKDELHGLVIMKSNGDQYLMASGGVLSASKFKGPLEGQVNSEATRNDSDKKVWGAVFN